MNRQGKTFGATPLFDPAEGLRVREPLEGGPGWWAGAPCATFDAQSDTFFLVYRLRQPREQGRGVECRIAASDDGIAFTDIWAMPKSSLNALSLERASLLRGFDGRWRLYLGHVEPSDGRWRISLMEADEPDQFDTRTATPLLTAADVGGEGVKDPNVFQIGRMYYLLASYATSEPGTPGEEPRKHASGDIYSTGLTRSRTGAAISGDGRHFQWIGDISPLGPNNPPVSGAGILAPGSLSPSGVAALAGEPAGKAAAGPHAAWDNYCRRIGALLPVEGGGYLAFYDGGASVADNYEERTGLAATFDLRTFYSLSPQQAALRSPEGSGSLRYVDVLPVGHELFYYYEVARADGAHELRVNVVERA